MRGKKKRRNAVPSIPSVNPKYYVGAYQACIFSLVNFKKIIRNKTIVS